MKTMKEALAPVFYLAQNWIGAIGVVLVTGATIFWLFSLPALTRPGANNPYAGILLFMVLPAIFFGGLFLIPVGILYRKRAEKRDIRPANPRRLLAFVAAMTFCNFVIASQLTYSAVTYMDSVTFCGQTCHTVMKPEFTAYQNSPHARVECVGCHIGPGASWFVKSKMSGLRQVYAVTFHTFSTPIPTPVENLRPARETCEACHWPAKFGGDRLRILSKYADDENNTPTKTVLLMHIGGGDGKGIHGMHMAPGVTITYASDPSRQKIPWVRYSKNGSPVTTYAEAGFKESSLANLTTRTMDCVDCHNRPSHTFELPERALDNALAKGAVSADLPEAKKEALVLLKASYSSTEDAQKRITDGFEAFYRSKYAPLYTVRAQDVKRSASAVFAIYARNVFPEMKINWGAYPNNLGHNDFPGCFRCHDGGHTATNGNAITQDCDACHKLLAMEEPSPKVLVDLGLAPEEKPADKKGETKNTSASAPTVAGGSK